MMIEFEKRKFCQVRTLCERWDCGRTMVYDMVSRGRLRAWHPQGQSGAKGMRIEVSSVIDAEKGGYIDLAG